MKGAVLVFLLALASCVDSTSQQCSWGVTCPSSRICDETHQLCVLQSQLDICSDKAELESCTFQGAAGGPYHCVGGTCVSAPFCGDGIVGTGEACDCGDGAITLPDGCLRPNGDDPDACRTDCVLPACGDGILDGGEACDDGNTTAGDGCNEECKFDGCGDGVRTDPEDCEGADLDGATCESLGFYGGTLGCRSICRYDTLGCTGRCGDGVLSLADDEQCDGTNLNGNTTCADIGYQSGTLACSPVCRYTGCTGFCGDGVRGGAEECDDADLGGATCASLGLVGGTLSCNPDCTHALRECDGGVCQQVKNDNGDLEEVFDDAACGAISCSGWYTIVGQQSPTTAKACHGRQPITTLRCESGDACKDPNTADCDTQLPAASGMGCGVCQFVSGCTGTTPGTCSPYAEFTKTTLCRECDGSTTTPRAAADDVECGTISCGDYYTQVNPQTITTLTTESCFAHFNRTASRCASAGTCFTANTAAACDSQPLLIAPAASCGVCKKLQAGTCTGTVDPVCVNDDEGLPTSGTCGVGQCIANKHCEGGLEVCNPGPPSSTDDPDDSFLDTNCDGVDGIAANAIFVATDGNDANPGTMAQPKQSIQDAINAANAAMPKKAVYVSNGTYTSVTSSITLATGVSIYGGYNRAAGWTRSDTRASINGHPTAIVGTSVSNIVIDHLTIVAATPTVAGTSSYAVRLDSASAITIRRSSLSAGNGADGADGVAGDVGSDGGDGGDGADGVMCIAPPRGAGGSGCSRGGPGGAAGAAMGDDGGDGLAGEPDPFSDGLGGFGGTGATGTLPGTPARAGTNGGAGLSGGNGAGAGSFGTTSTSTYLPPNGTRAATGEDGGGGGGGGGGAGQSQFGCPSNAGYGTSGGGGGGGGCGGVGGAGGAGGGGSFALWVNSSTGVTVTSCDLTTARGGSGGDGGIGGNGGAGGIRGGSLGGPFGGGVGTPGGDGGRGGRGGTGGGGGGGPSVGIVLRASTVTQTANTFNLGVPGGGGSVDGATGVRAMTHTLP